jgi:hypothetical protein
MVALRSIRVSTEEHWTLNVRQPSGEQDRLFGFYNLPGNARRSVIASNCDSAAAQWDDCVHCSFGKSGAIQ